MRTYPLYIFDLDGTLFRGEEPTPNAVDTLVEIRRRGAQVRFLTNNSGRSVAWLQEKLHRLGFRASASEIMTSGVGAAHYLRGRGLGSAFVVGEPALIDALEAGGVPVFKQGPVDAVVVGICRNFTYDWMNEALQRLIGGAKLVATNPDVTYPLEGGRLEPGAGAVLAGIQTCSGVEPEVVGKPNPYLVKLILAEAQVAPEDALVVGDRPETDLLAGTRAGCPTHLVLCGVTQTAPLGCSSSADVSGLL